MAPLFNKTVIQNLTETEKMRIVCAYLHHNNPNDVDWDAAAAQMGSASTHSFRVMHGPLLKKIRTAPGDGDGPEPRASVSATPKKGRKKRAAEGEVEEESPKKKTPKKTKAKMAEAESKVEEQGPLIKPEQGSDLDQDDFLLFSNDADV